MENKTPFITAEQHPSRRTVMQLGGALAAVMLAAAPRLTAAVASTPVSGAGDADGAPWLIQSFSRGSLFPTQGDAGVLPYTLILWDAAAQGIVVVDPARSAVGIAPTGKVLAALASAPEPALAIVMAPPETDAAAAPDTVWVLRLVSGSLGADPGAVTYQGEVLAAADATEVLGMPAAAPPEGPRDVAGYLLLTGLSAGELLEDGLALPWG